MPPPVSAPLLSSFAACCSVPIYFVLCGGLDRLCHKGQRRCPWENTLPSPQHRLSPPELQRWYVVPSPYSLDPPPWLQAPADRLVRQPSSRPTFVRKPAPGATSATTPADVLRSRTGPLAGSACLDSDLIESIIYDVEGDQDQDVEQDQDQDVEQDQDQDVEQDKDQDVEQDKDRPSTLDPVGQDSAD
ncbi:putative transmembrane protein [Gregarina niphandrodes]|uniref:Transmembrane protein n=1 Tax=Gregarina niphandrodes TaxID=110365 RepID=A0A023B726_GRENI|nr:putative transmembrane protein [Gregarina niphandrodes]EZG66897.1 putative transmembrane protein [Gregarina niphandrodes]|eukprot:XP_011130430.1 putative transmembrane protein [Gregarina niphandrodes]